MGILWDMAEIFRCLFKKMEYKKDSHMTVWLSF